MKQAALLLGLLLGAGAACVGGHLSREQIEKLPAPAPGKIDFVRDIKPVFEASCVKCHGRGKAKGGFKLETREALLEGGDSGPVAVPGKSAESYLIELVSGLDPENVMPAKGSKLTAAQVGLLRAWIDQGLEWGTGVTFARPPPLNLHPHRPETGPASSDSKHPVDRLLDAYFAAHQIPMPGRVADRTFARRVYLDVIGLLPDPTELERFVRDKRSDKRARLVARLLADERRYAEHWLSFWNDLLRNDYKGTGYIDGGREQISSWLYAALYQNRPYDRFVAELIHPVSKSAGFTKGIVWRGAVNASQIPPMQAAQNISQVFMGVNLKCASCHDSFINDWALADAYALANVYADEPLEIFQCDKPTGKKAAVGFIYRELGEIPAQAPKAERTRRLAEILTQKRNGRLTRTIVNRLWAKFLGRGLIEPVDDMEQRAWDQDLLDWLAEDLADNGYDLKHTMKRILTSQAYQLPPVNLDEQKRADYVFTGPAVRRLTAEQFRDALGTLTGVWYAEAAKGINLAVPAGPETRSNAVPDSVKWIWSEPNADSSAKVETIYLRRIFVLTETPKEAWAVATCDNSYSLYVNGTKAISARDWSEPNLADLRPQLKKGTNVLAVVAVNYTPDDQPPAADQSSADAEPSPAGFIFYVRIKLAGETLDVGTDRSWVWSRKHKEGWEKPDSVLEEAKPAVELGPPAMAPWSLDRQLSATLTLAQAHRDVRAGLVAADPLAVALGRPNREQVMTTRATAATTLQALELTNGDTLSSVLKRGAKVLASKSGSNQDLVTGLYRRALGRKPTPAEMRLANELLGQPAKPEQVEDLLWSMAMLPEFQLIY